MYDFLYFVIPHHYLLWEHKSEAKAVKSAGLSCIGAKSSSQIHKGLEKFRVLYKPKEEATQIYQRNYYQRSPGRHCNSRYFKTLNTTLRILYISGARSTTTKASIKVETTQVCIFLRDVFKSCYPRLWIYEWRSIRTGLSRRHIHWFPYRLLKVYSR